MNMRKLPQNGYQLTKTRNSFARKIKKESAPSKIKKIMQRRLKLCFVTEYCQEEHDKRDNQMIRGIEFTQKLIIESRRCDR